MRGDIHPLHIDQPHERPLSDRLMVKVPARSILPMLAFRDARCITHNPVNGTGGQRRCSAISDLAKSQNRNVDNLLGTRCESRDAETVRQSEPA
jgi:hypothetical protein